MATVGLLNIPKATVKEVLIKTRPPGVSYHTLPKPGSDVPAITLTRTQKGATITVNTNAPHNPKYSFGGGQSDATFEVANNGTVRSTGNHTPWPSLVEAVKEFLIRRAAY